MSDDTPQQQSLSSRSFKAALWSLAGKGGSDLLKLTSNLILTRLLFPDAFGLMGTAMGVMLMVQLFTDTGTRLSIIQNPRGSEPAFLNTAWMVGILRGAGLSLLLLALSWPLAAFYGKPGLAHILMLLALMPLISGFENPAMALVVRQMKGHRQILYDLAPQIGGFVCTVTLAWLYRSVWALAIGALLVSLARLIASYVVEPYHPRFVWDDESGRSLVNFGKFVLLNTMICWSATNLDGFIVGKMLGMSTLGVYTIGQTLGVSVELFFNQLLGNSYYPALSQVLNDRPRCVRVFMRSLTTLMALASPILVTLILFSNQVIAILYDSRYAAAGVVLCWVCIRGLFRIVSIISGSTLMAFGLPRCETVAMGVALTTLLLLQPAGIHYFGTKGALIAILATGIAGMLVQSRFLVHELGFPVKAVAIPLTQAAAVAAVSLAAHTLLHPWLDAPRWQAIPFMLAVAGVAALTSFLGWRFAQRAVPGGTA